MRLFVCRNPSLRCHIAVKGVRLCVSKVDWFPVAQSAVVELACLTVARYSFIRFKTVSPRESVGCVVVGSETDVEYTENRV